LVAEAALDLQPHVDRGVLGQVADHVVGVEHLDVVVGLDVGGGNRARAGFGQAQAGGLAGAHADGDVLEVEQHLQHVFLQALDGAVFMQHAVDLDLGDGETGDGRQQNAAQGVAERVAVATLQRLDQDLGAIAVQTLDLRSARTQDLVGGNRHIREFSCNEPPGGGWRRICSFALGAPLTQGGGQCAKRIGQGCGGICWSLGKPDPADRPVRYLEYSSTISASLMSADRSPRSGTALNTPLNFLASTSIQPGDRSICADTSSASCTRICFWAFSVRAIASPALTWYDGRFTTWPLTVTPRWATSWRAAGRVTAKPMR